MSSESIASRLKSNKRQFNSNLSKKSETFGSKSKKRRKLNKKSNKSTDCHSIGDSYESNLTIDDLNDDVLEEILSRLPFVDKIRSQIVCKRWQQSITHLLSKQTALGMKNIGYDRSDCSLNSRHSVVEEDIIDIALYESNTSSNDFDLRNAVQRNQSHCLRNLRTIFTKCPKILALNLLSVELTDSYIELIDEFCPKLECLHLNSMVIRDSVWQQLTKRLSNRLIHLTIRNSIKLNQKEFVEKLIRSCGQLKCLKVTEWKEDLHFKWFEYISDSVDEIHIACTSAKHLFKCEENKIRDNIKILKLSTFVSFSQSVYNRIGDNFKNLTKIDLRICEGCNKRSYRPFAKLSQLTDLTLDLPYANCDEDFAILTQNCTKIRKIELNFGLLTLNSLRIIGKNWNHLESVSFRYVTIEKFNESLDVFIGWKYLRRLDLKGTNICDDICQVIEMSDSLRYLKLDMCQFISKSVVDSFISRSKLSPKQLFELSVKETKIQKLNAFKNINHVTDGIIKINNLYVYFSSKESEIVL